MKVKYYLPIVVSFLIFACQPADKQEEPEREGIVSKQEMADEILLVAGELSEELYAFHDLQFPADALEPFIDRNVMVLHYDKHYKAYFKNFLKAVKGTTCWGTSLEQIFDNISNCPIDVRNYVGGYYNHWFFWGCMSPEKSSVSEALMDAIENDFGSFKNFQEEFKMSAVSSFGSGWTWLILLPENHLAVINTPNQDNPLMDISPVKGIPILVIDMWEHAYYLQYENRKSEYVDNFWNVINWERVNERYEMALEHYVDTP